MNQETGKQRSQRIEIDYYRQPTGLTRWRTLCIALGLLLGLGYAAYALVASPATTQLSTGPVALCHAAFENDCSACHEGFAPMDPATSDLDISLAGIFASENLATIEAKCLTCHPVGTHFRDQLTLASQSIDQNCAACHHDHRGRDFAIVSHDARQCTQCHADLSAVCRQPPQRRNRVVGFSAADHGEFSSLATDPGVVKFDHAQHMLPGQVAAGSRGQFLHGMLSDSDRIRYGGPDADGDTPVQLSCASCHEMTEASFAARSIGESGRGIEPIDFETHCAACHSMMPGPPSEATLPIPHAVAWSQVQLLIDGNAAGEAVSGSRRPVDNDRQTEAKVGEGFGGNSRRNLSTPPPAAEGDRPAKTEQTVSVADVRDQCLKCHDDASVTDQRIASASAGLSEPMIPERFLQWGEYDHGAHAAMDCRACHAAAYPSETRDGSGPPSDHTTVMIDNIDSCTECHRDPESPTPASLVSGKTAELLGDQATWASDACTTCHGYHTHAAAAVTNAVAIEPSKTTVAQAVAVGDQP